MGGDIWTFERKDGRTDGQTASYRTSALWGRCPKRMDENEDSQQLGRTATWTGSNMDRLIHGWTNIRMSTEEHKDEQTDGHKGHKGQNLL